MYVTERLLFKLLALSYVSTKCNLIITSNFKKVDTSELVNTQTLVSLFQILATVHIMLMHIHIACVNVSDLVKIKKYLLINLGDS